MWPIDDIVLLMVLVYAALGIALAILIALRRRKSHGSSSGHGKTQTPAQAGNNIYVVNGRYELMAPPHKQGGMATIWFAPARCLDDARPACFTLSGKPYSRHATLFMRRCH